MYLQYGLKGAENQIKKAGVMNFEKIITRQTKLDFDESPFVYLTANPTYLDVLCVICYECVKLLEVE